MAGDKRQESGGLGGLLLPLAVVTLIGGGGGAFLGASLLPQTGAPGPGPAPASAPAKEAHGKGHKEAPDAGAPHADAARSRLEVKELPPIVANLGGDGKRLVRLQSAIVYDPQELTHVDAIVAALMSDATAFLGTIELASIEGPDGLRRLQEELSERAATRSERRIREFVVEGLVVQ